LIRFARQWPVLAREMGREAREFRPDLVYLNGPRVLPSAAWAGVQAPVLFHAHSALPAGLMGRLAGWALRRLRAQVVASCSFVAKAWEPVAGQSGIPVVWNGVGGPDAPVYRSNPAAPCIGCIGRISPEKGQLEFIAAARAIERGVPNSRFAIYGASLFSSDAADYEARVRAAAAGLPVEYAGWVSDVYAALAKLDLLLVPSGPQEATTRVILEAGAAGVPVIAFRSGGIPEVVADGETGFLVDSAAEMAERAIELLRGDPSRLMSLSHAAREYWSARFTAERWQAQMIAHFENAVV
jgi:glycosyltransferase involved in cell wall biosynthesis